MIDSRKGSFFLSKKVFHAIFSSNLLKKMTKQNINHVKKPRFSKIRLFSRQIVNLCENESRNPQTFFHYKSSGVKFYILRDFDQNLSIDFLEKSKQLYKMA